MFSFTVFATYISLSFFHLPSFLNICFFLFISLFFFIFLIINLISLHFLRISIILPFINDYLLCYSPPFIFSLFIIYISFRSLNLFPYPFFIAFLITSLLIPYHPFESCHPLPYSISFHLTILVIPFLSCHPFPSRQSFYDKLLSKLRLINWNRELLRLS